MELSREQIEQQDDVDNSAYQLLCTLARDEIEWDIEKIGTVRDVAIRVLEEAGLPVHFASVDEDDNVPSEQDSGGYWIPEHYMDGTDSEEYDMSFPTFHEAQEYAEMVGSEMPIRKGKNGPEVTEYIDDYPVEDEGPYIIEEGDEWECPYCEQLMTAQDDVSSSPDGTAHTACVEARIAAGDPHF